MSMRIAYFISSHGFGHATRASAVMAALAAQLPAVQFDIFSRVPRWLFEDSLPGRFDYHPLTTDVGLVQRNSLHEDIPATVAALRQLIPFAPDTVAQLAGQLRAMRPACRLVLCDIAPLGLAVAEAAGIPSVLVENFTWDWIYAGYPGEDGDRLAPFGRYLAGQFGRATYHVQTEPVCAARPLAHLTSAPVSRQPRAEPEQVRRRLGLRPADKLVVVTMGGMAADFGFLREAEDLVGVKFVVMGGQVASRGAVVGLPQRSDIFHPDLINAADAVISKVGYSTLAEVYHAGVPLGYVGRARFRESAVLAAYIAERMPSRPISEAALHNGAWRQAVEQLLAMPRRQPPQRNGAQQIAAFVAKQVERPG
ncbi:MAG: hypothetical protein Kow0031_06250 [Anaerolineae bacterium]